MSPSLQHSIDLGDGLRVPRLGFGTWRLFGADAERAVRTALEVGYRHLDTAQAYDNEAEVGRAMAASGLDRAEVFVTTKLLPSHAASADVRRSTGESLRRLGLDHVDLLLLHWPADDVAPLEETLEAMTWERDAGRTRAIGVSNFPSDLLRRAYELAPIVTDQVEHHPFLAVTPIEAVLAERGGFVTAYSPLARGEVADDAVLRDIADAHGVTPAQVTLRWMLQRPGVVTIPKSGDPGRIRENHDLGGFALDEAEMRRIDGRARGRRLIDPPDAPTWDDAD
jgi:2,5-diketo-D-gluconate reductase B